jgi:prepilin-type N-terminal cleavage/methylation domain-containing protein
MFLFVCIFNLKKGEFIMKKLHNFKKGFTLIEMLIVVAIIGVLVLIFAPSFNVFNKANGTSLNGKSKSVSNAVFQYMADNNNAYPFLVQPSPGPSSTGGIALTDFTTPDDLATLIGSTASGTARLSGVTDTTTLTDKLLPFLYKIDPTLIGKYLKGSTFATGDYLMVVNDIKNAAYVPGGLANPTIAPNATASAGSATLPTASYYVAYTWVGPNGQTKSSAIAPAQAITLGQNLNITIPALPSGATSANVFVSTVIGSETLQGNITGTVLTISAPLVAGAARPNVSDIIASSGQLDALDGTILSKVTVKDSDNNYYNGILKNK